MIDSKSCTRRTLAASDFTRVERCSCGSVHVTIGAVTLRLASSAIPALAATLGDAARALVLQETLGLAPGPVKVMS